MNEYLLQHTLQSLGGSVSVVEFSPNGRFLIVGEGQPARLQVLDRLAGFCPTIEADTISQPTSFVFESSATFLAGLDDGRFVVYSIDLRSKRLIKGWTNNVLRGPSSVAAIALNETSQILALAVGPSVFVFRRISETGEFQFTANISSYFDLESNPIKPPSPTSLCFSSNGQLHVAFCRQHVASVKLTFERCSGLQTAFPAVGIDYSGLSILTAALSPDDEKTPNFGRFWIHGFASAPQFGSDSFPFLFINNGVATLSTSPSGTALIRNVVTQRVTQLLKHDDIATRPLTIAYHSGKQRHTIATANCDSIKIWKADKIPTTREMSVHASKSRSWGLVGLIMVVLAVNLLCRGNLFDKRQLWAYLKTGLFCWIRFCCTALVYIEATIKGVLKERCRDIGVTFMRLTGEVFDGR